MFGILGAFGSFEFVSDFEFRIWKFGYLILGALCAFGRDTFLLRFPLRIALGDGDEDYGNHGNHQTDGCHPAAHTVKIEKV